jgi:recombination protein RecA
VPIEDQDRFLLACPDTLEEGMKILWACATNGVDLLVIDSVGAGVPEDQLNEKDKGRMGRVGLIAAKWSMYLPQFQRCLRKSGSTVIAISQLRKKINTGGYGGDTTQVQGGEAWKFYSTLRIKLARVKTERGKSYNAATHKVEEQVYGGVCKAKLDKNKISATQGNDIEYYIRWGEGIDDVRSIMEIASKHGIVKKAGAWYKWNRPDGSEIAGQGIEKFRQGIIAADAFDELYKLTIDKLMGEHDGSTPLIDEDDFDDLSFMTPEADSPTN